MHYQALLLIVSNILKQACRQETIIYQKWSGPLQYCSVKNISDGNASETITSFNGPSEPGAMQGLLIAATVTVFLAAVSGGVDAGANKKPAGISAFFWSLVAFVLCLSSYCLWSAFPYVQQIQATPPTVYLPVWQNYSTNELSAVPAYNVWLGSAWGTALTASILIFFAGGVHLASLFGETEEVKKKNENPPQGSNV